MHREKHQPAKDRSTGSSPEAPSRKIYAVCAHNGLRLCAQRTVSLRTDASIIAERNGTYSA